MLRLGVPDVEEAIENSSKINEMNGGKLPNLGSKSRPHLHYLPYIWIQLTM